MINYIWTFINCELIRVNVYGQEHYYNQDSINIALHTVKTTPELYVSEKEWLANIEFFEAGVQVFIDNCPI